jgi:hypothetical protein
MEYMGEIKANVSKYGIRVHSVDRLSVELTVSRELEQYLWYTTHHNIYPPSRSITTSTIVIPLISSNPP